MTWLFPAVVATLIGTLILTCLYFYLYYQDRNRYMLIWAFSWTFYAIRYSFMLLIIQGNNADSLLIANQLTSLVSGIFLLWGTYLFMDRKIPVFWIPAGMAGGIWIIVSITAKLPFMVMSLPTFTFLAFVNIYTGIIFLKAKKESRTERSLVGISFVLWGIHKADYPFLRPVVWFAPWGYLFSAVLEFTVAIGIVLLYFRRTKDKLRQSIVQMRTLIETIPDLVWLKDPNGVYLACNLKFERLFGAKEEEIIGKTDYDFVDKKLADFFRQKDSAAIKAGRPCLNEEEVVYADDGHKECLETIKTPMVDNNGNIIGVLGIARDITSRKQAEKDIRVITESTVGHIGQDLFNHTVEILCRWLKCNCAIIGELIENDKVRSLAMYMDGQFIDNYQYDLKGTPCSNVDQKGFCLFEEGVREKFPGDKDLARMNAQGYIGTPLMGDRNEVIGILCAISQNRLEIPEHIESVINIIAARISAALKRKNEQKALLESETRFALAMEASRDGLFDWNLITNEIYFAPAWKQMLGYRNQELPNDLSVWETLTATEDVGALRQIQNDLITRKRDRFEVEFEMKHKNGHFVNILSRARAKFNSEGKAVRIVGTHTDITERKKMERQLQQAQRMQSIGNLAGGIAHDFNNILYPIIGMSELLMNDLKPDSLEYNNANEIFKAGRRGSELVKQILAFSRQTEHKLVPLRIENVIQEALKLTRASIPADIEIKHRIQKNCSLTKADATQIHQVIMNLITNAYHALEDAGGEIFIELFEKEFSDEQLKDTALSTGSYLVLRVSDTGTGMDKSIIKNIFEPYFTTKDQGKGTGLGLAVVYGIIKEHNGDITVKTVKGKGSTFTIYLPVIESIESTEDDTDTAQIKTGSERILIVDDEQAIAGLAAQFLGRLGYQTFEETDSLAALERFKNEHHNFDLVITDMTMPNLTGDLLSRQLLEIRPDIPIIICTGFSERINEEQARAIGVRAFLLKPVSMQELADTVRNVMDGIKMGNNR